jgi:hypothetical protein
LNLAAVKKANGLVWHHPYPNPMASSLQELIADSWATLNQVFYKFLVNPWLVSLLISFTIAMLLFSPNFTGREWIVLALGLILVAYCLLTAPPLVALTEGILMHFVPADTGETGDAIVVIGRGQGERGDRYAIAMQLLAEGRAPQLFVTDETNFQYVAALRNTYTI